MESQLAQLSNHMVVCGFGRMGQLVCEEFSAAGLPFVVVDREPTVLQDFAMPHGLPLSGDATNDDVLPTLQRTFGQSAPPARRAALPGARS